MPINYTDRGYLYPPDRQNLSIDDLQKHFVDDFPDSTTRKDLFEGYIKYNQAFRKEVTPEMTQWIGGSFTTKKRNPKDIDVVTIIPYEVFEEKKALIEDKFRKISKQKYGVDAYIVSAYPEDHEKHGLTQGILVYWDNQFSKTRKNRAGKRFKRGYIQIIHHKFAI